MTTLNLDLDALSQQIQRRATIEVERRCLAKEEEAARAALKEAQQDRPDYPELLRAQVRSCLKVEHTGDYPVDLAECIAALSNLIGEIPDDLLVADHKGITNFGRGCILQLGLMTFRGSSWLLNPDAPKVEIFIKKTLGSMLPVRIFLNLLSNAELQKRIFTTCIGTPLSARLASLYSIMNTVFCSYSGTVDTMLERVDQVRTQWDEFLDDVERVNKSGFTLAFADVKCSLFPQLDPIYVLGQEMTGSDLVYHMRHNRLLGKPAPEVVLSLWDLASRMEAAWLALTPTNQQRLAEGSGLPYHFKHKTIKQRLFNALVVCGAWSVHQCIEHSSWTGSLHEEVMQQLTSFIESRLADDNVEVAVLALIKLYHLVGPAYGFNCPEDKLYRDLHLEPLRYLALVSQADVLSILRRFRNGKKLRVQMDRLEDLNYEHAHWHKNGLTFRYYWMVTLSPEAVAIIWKQCRNDQNFWDERKRAQEEARKAS